MGPNDTTSHNNLSKPLLGRHEETKVTSSNCGDFRRCRGSGNKWGIEPAIGGSVRDAGHGVGQ